MKSEKNYIVVECSDSFKNMVGHIREADLVAYDTETTGLNVRKDKIIGFSVSAREGWGFYLPLLRYDGEDLVTVFSREKAIEVLKELRTKKLIMFNASFDARITKNDLGVDLLTSLYADAMLLKHTCDEEHPFGLKAIAKKIQGKIGLNVDEEANQEQVDMLKSIKDNGGSTTKDQYELYKADMYKIGIYACADTDLTLRVFNYYSTILKEEGLEDFFYKDEVMPLYKHVTIPMEDRGIPLDVGQMEIAIQEIQKDIEELEDIIQAKIRPHLGAFTDWFLDKEFPPRRSGSFVQALCTYADLSLPKTKSGRYSVSTAAIDTLEPSFYKKWLKGQESELPYEVVRACQRIMWEASGDRHMFNISSKYHLAKLFFDGLGEQSVTKTPKGRPQMNDLFLEEAAKKYDFAQDIRIYNKLNKLKSAYMERFIEEHEGGIFYPSFKQHRTISGRYGSDLQQLPRPYEGSEGVDPRVLKYTNMIRGFFVSGPGYVFIDSDYESLEPHVFAHVSGDERLKDIFRSGHDFYSTIAIQTENLQGVSADKSAENYLKKVSPGARQRAKAYSLGIPYGMEAFKLSKTIDVSQEEAEKLVKQYLDAFPDLSEWMRRSEEQCKHYGVVRSEAGRKRHMKLASGIFFQEKSVLFDAEGRLIDSLKLWQKFAEDNPSKYQSYKWKRKQFKNFLNNSKNFQIQSLAASITNRACIAIAKELKRQNIDGYVCAQVHDQIVVRVPDNKAEKCKKMVQFLMENTYKISLPLRAPAEIAKNLRDGH